MRIIIPMAGIGKRMRPHTLTVPKPLIMIAGKPIVQRLVEDIRKIINKKIDEIAFVIGDFGKAAEDSLLSITKNLDITGKIYYQKEALGTAHAIYCAKDSLDGEIIIAYADTLFRADFKPDNNYDGTIWIHKVKDPSLFGVVITENNIIKNVIEKPKDLISNQAIIGIYYLKDGKNFKNELDYLTENKIMKAGEYQLTDVLQNMMKKGKVFTTAEVEEWLDCGNKNATVYTNQRILEFSKNDKLISDSVIKTNSIIIPPCYLGDDVKIKNSIIGPYVSIGNKTIIDRSVISKSIIQNNSYITCATLENSMIGSYVEFHGEQNEVSIGDYTILD